MSGEEMAKKMLELVSRQDHADEQPAEKCVEGKEHEYRTVGHADGEDFYEWYFESEHCNHMMKMRAIRAREDRKLWSP